MGGGRHRITPSQFGRRDQKAAALKPRPTDGGQALRVFVFCAGLRRREILRQVREADVAQNDAANGLA